ncbi:MAG: hypothetical protein JWP91_2163 [Fibrobacteres bacterium]|nr:hypothetical protein [Fibrobacterota bacterium]
MKVIARIAIASLLGSSPGCPAGFAGWADSTLVLLNTTSSGADVGEDQAGFPVLVRLAAGDFIFSEARSDGADLRFADQAGAALPFELERFDPAGKVAEFWVLVPIVKGNEAEQGFKMYWGNPSASPASSGPAVFPAAGDFSGVWHLGEDGGSAAGAYKDASSFGNHGTGAALTAASDVAGMIGSGTLFMAGSNQGVTVPAQASLHPTGGLTVEAWIKSTSQGAYRRFMGKPFSAVAAPWNEYSLEADITGTMPTFSVTLGDAEAGVIGTTAMVDGIWYHVAGTYDGSMQKIYVNGVLEASIARTGSVSDYGQALSIGKYGLDNGSNFDGAVDEARFSRTARSAGWIKLAYANQRAGQKLVTFRKFASCTAVFSVPVDTAVAEGASTALAAVSDCADAYSWSIVSGPAPRLLDPEVKVLQVVMPRVTRDTVIVYRFTADYGGTLRTGDVKVSVKEAIPDPLFTLPALPNWNGSDTLVVKPAISNAAAVQASREPAIHYAWTLAGVPVDSVSLAGSIALTGPARSGSLTIGLCLDNGGPVACKETTVNVSVPVGIRSRTARGAAFGRPGAGRWDAKGRPHPGKSRRTR